MQYQRESIVAETPGFSNRLGDKLEMATASSMSPMKAALMLKVGQQVWKVARRHPLPAALVFGLGAAWMIKNRRIPFMGAI